jgi:putative membrane protein
VSGVWPYLAGIGFILSTSAVYEIIEWMLAMLMAPDWAESYNGQQGDIWDAQRDMALAAIGSLISVAVLATHD